MAANIDETAILDEYTRSRSGERFAELVALHANWINSAALRMTKGDAAMAEDVTQAVFLLLADRPQKAQGRPLGAWLFKATRYCAMNAMRAQARRSKHERRAAMIRSEAVAGQDIWESTWPLIDEMVRRLRKKDHELVLARFYEGKSL